MQLRQGLLDRGHQRPVAGRRHVLDRRLPLQATGNQVGDDLGVGRRAEQVALGLEHLLERLEVLDHAVVDHGQLAVPADMGVRVLVARRAVRGPAGMADADPARGRRLGQAGLQPVDPPGRLAEGQFPLGGDGGHAGAVVAPIFQAAEAAQQVVNGLS